MSKIGRAFHWVLTIGNGLLAITSLAAGRTVQQHFPVHSPAYSLGN